MPPVRLRRLLPALYLLQAIACGGGSVPTTPTAPPTLPGAGPAASFRLTVDSLGSEEALSGVSEVVVDTSGSTGPGARYRVEFGDGATSTEALARHVYDKPGTYQVSVTLTDDTGRSSTTMRQLVVASPLGARVFRGYLARARKVEVRTLTLTSQLGLAVGGVLARLGEHDLPVTGSLTSDRRVRLVVDGGWETLEGTLPSVLTGDHADWSLSARGGPIDGETLTFKPRGEPTGVAPDAVLKMRFFAFSAPFAVKQISPVQFDGSSSRGEDLMCFIQFGDGQSVADVTAVHPMDKPGIYTARLTIADRFGRGDVEEASFEVKTLVANSPYYGWEATGPLHAWLYIAAQEGTVINGSLNRYGEGFAFGATGRPFIGTVNADGQVRLTMTMPDEDLTGTLSLPSIYDIEQRLTLTYVTGPHTGDTIYFHFRSGY